ncbi:hypothetical protein B0H66DRAFT_320533 [Apodospora peruviana]|uniref:Uncharacterized protein n=1 Tax=Apodospora peruviana TaxID=516989 RepID=A0AAE0HXK7_9PEZI|nr:hypothetical protein B0H66DRAFT_320533 [Apodospora peruviana]
MRRGDEGGKRGGNAGWEKTPWEAGVGAFCFFKFFISFFSSWCWRFPLLYTKNASSCSIPSFSLQGQKSNILTTYEEKKLLLFSRDHICRGCGSGGDISMSSGVVYLSKQSGSKQAGQPNSSMRKRREWSRPNSAAFLAKKHTRRKRTGSLLNFPACSVVCVCVRAHTFQLWPTRSRIPFRCCYVGQIYIVVSSPSMDGLTVQIIAW